MHVKVTNQTTGVLKTVCFLLLSNIEICLFLGYYEQLGGPRIMQIWIVWPSMNLLLSKMHLYVLVFKTFDKKRTLKFDWNSSCLVRFLDIWIPVCPKSAPFQDTLHPLFERELALLVVLQGRIVIHLIDTIVDKVCYSGSSAS